MTDPGIDGSDEQPPLALVMGGGGARAAYQVGFLRAIARRYPDLRVPILTGVSAGAINAVHLAAHPGSFAEAVDDLVELWCALSVDKVYRTDSYSILRKVVRWGVQILSGGLSPSADVRSLVDTSPLERFLRAALDCPSGPIPGIAENLRSGRLDALAISTSSYTTGRSVTWVQGRNVEPWERPQRRSRIAEIGMEHVLASAALPLFFPAVQIEDEWYGDGGIRLSAPLSPALHLGAGRVIAISTRFDRLRNEAERPTVEGYPPVAQVVGSLMNAVFLDLLDQDAWRVEAMNRLLLRLPEGDRMGMRPVNLLTLRPSQDLGRLSQDYELDLPGSVRFLMRGLGTRETSSPDMLSFLMFDPGYLGHLIEMGDSDGEARMGEVEALIEGGAGIWGEDRRGSFPPEPAPKTPRRRRRSNPPGTAPPPR